MTAAGRPTHEKARAPCDRSGRSGRHIALESLEPSPQAASMVPASRTRSNALNRRARCAQRGRAGLSPWFRALRLAPNGTTATACHAARTPHESLLHFTDAERASRRPSHPCTGSDSPRASGLATSKGRPSPTPDESVYQASGTPAAQAACRVVATIGSNQKSLPASSWLPDRRNTSARRCRTQASAASRRRGNWLPRHATGTQNACSFTSFTLPHQPHITPEAVTPARLSVRAKRAV